MFKKMKYKIGDIFIYKGRQWKIISAYNLKEQFKKELKTENLYYLKSINIINTSAYSAVGDEDFIKKEDIREKFIKLMESDFKKLKKL